MTTAIAPVSSNRMLAALSQARANPRRFDSWENQLTGFGTDRDKTTYTMFVGVSVLSDSALSNLYHGDDVAQRMVNVVPDEMLREGFSVDTGDERLNAELDEFVDARGLFGALAGGLRWGRLFGGAALVIGADDGRSAAAPLVPERARELSYLYEIDRRYLWPFTWYKEPGHPKLGQPETYMVSSFSAHSAQQVSVVHETRLVLFGGATTGARERELLGGWDHSVLQAPFDTLRSFNTGWKAVEVLLTDGNQAVFKMSGLADAIAQGQSSALSERLRAIDMARSHIRAVVIDAGGGEDEPEESFERQVFPMTGIAETLDKLMLRMAAAVQIPVTILMGQSPAGMNATGVSDFRWFYDRMRSQQQLYLAPRIRRILKVQLAAMGAQPKKLDIKFPPLWTETPLEQAQTRKAIIEGDAAGVNASIWLPEEVALHRGQPDGWDKDLQLTPEGVKARQSALADELKTPDASTGDGGGEGEGGDDIQKTVLNGAQIASLVDIVAQVAAGTIPRDSAIASIALSFQVSEQEAAKLLGSAGTPKFTPTQPEPTGFGGGFGGKPKPDASAQEPIPGASAGAEGKPDPEARGAEDEEPETA